MNSKYNSISFWKYVLLGSLISLIINMAFFLLYLDVTAPDIIYLFAGMSLLSFILTLFSFFKILLLWKDTENNISKQLETANEASITSIIFAVVFLGVFFADSFHSEILGTVVKVILFITSVWNVYNLFKIKAHILIKFLYLIAAIICFLIAFQPIFEILLWMV